MFALADYLVFGGALLITMGIGIFYAISSRRENTLSNFFTGDRELRVLPLTISLVVSVISAVTLLGLPAEMYSYGSQYFFNVGSGFGIVLTAVIFVPLLHPLKMTSLYEYLERRFNSKTVRMIGSMMEILAMLLYGGAALFAPVTALSGVTKIPIWILSISLGALVIFYTAVGGIRAVIWTDVVQAAIMLIGITAALIKGILDVGGFNEVVYQNRAAGRLNFYDFDLDPRVRHTFWGLTLGFGLGGFAFYGATQFSFQRFTAAKTLKDAKLTVWLNLPIFYLFHILLCFLGLVMFTFYAQKDCDPVGAKIIKGSNQLLPLYVMDTLGSIPGLPGLFISALTSSALSTISSLINSLSALMWEDLLKSKLGHLSDRSATCVIKFLVCLCGCVVIGVTFLVESYGPHIFQVCFAFLGATGGPKLGMLVLGALFPRANAKGAITGCLIGLALTSWISIDSYINKSYTPPLPGPSTNGCISLHTNDLNFTTFNSSDNQVFGIPTESTDLWLTTYAPSLSTDGFLPDEPIAKGGHQISYTWYTAVGMVTCIFVGLLVSVMTGREGSVADDSPLVMPWSRNIKRFIRGICNKQSNSTDDKYKIKAEEEKLRTEIEGQRNTEEDKSKQTDTLV